MNKLWNRIKRTFTPKPEQYRQYTECVVDGPKGPFVLGKAIRMNSACLDVLCLENAAKVINELRRKETVFLCGFVRPVAFRAVIEDWEYSKSNEEPSFIRIYLHSVGEPLILDD